MELTNWRELSDRGPDLVPCLDFPGARAAAGFAELAAGVPVDACFLHVRAAGAGPLAACAGRWAGELLATGRRVRAVLGYCAGAALAAGLADAVAGAGPPPAVVLFDAVATTGGSLAGQFVLAVESSARYLTAEEVADARSLSEQLVAAYPDDLPRIAAALTGRYDQLIGAVAGRVPVSEVLRRELTGAFAAYLDYLVLAGEGGFGTRTAAPLFVCSAGWEPPVQGARAVVVDAGHDGLLCAPQVLGLVADLLTGGHPW